VGDGSKEREMRIPSGVNGKGIEEFHLLHLAVLLLKTLQALARGEADEWTIVFTDRTFRVAVDSFPARVVIYEIHLPARGRSGELFDSQA
jgi:hypothetical protein